MTQIRWELSDREIIALHVFLTTNEQIDEAALTHVKEILDEELIRMRKRLGVVRFGALIKNSWRRSSAEKLEDKSDARS